MRGRVIRCPIRDRFKFLRCYCVAIRRVERRNHAYDDPSAMNAQKRSSNLMARRALIYESRCLSLQGNIYDTMSTAESGFSIIFHLLKLYAIAMLRISSPIKVRPRDFLLSSWSSKIKNEKGIAAKHSKRKG